MVPNCLYFQNKNLVRFGAFLASGNSVKISGNEKKIELLYGINELKFGIGLY